MNYKALSLAGAGALAALSSVPAAAAPVLFELSGSRNATFTIDSDDVPDFLSLSGFGNQISYNNVAGTYGGAPGSGTIGFGTGIFADLNVGGTALGFTQFAGPDLFMLANSKPVFNSGTFALTSIVSGSSTLTISTVSAVPEPATWAMMLAGFGGAGFLVRRRKLKAAVSFA